MKKSVKIFLIVTTTIGVSLIVAGLVLMLMDKLNEVRCYHLPLNDFYNDTTCLKYVMELE